MKATTRYSIVRKLLLAALLLTVAVCLIPMTVAEPFARLFDWAAEWFDFQDKRMRRKMHVKYVYDGRRRKAVLVEDRDRKDYGAKRD